MENVLQYLTLRTMLLLFTVKYDFLFCFCCVFFSFKYEREDTSDLSMKIACRISTASTLNLGEQLSLVCVFLCQVRVFFMSVSVRTIARVAESPLLKPLCEPGRRLYVFFLTQVYGLEEREKKTFF